MVYYVDPRYLHSQNELSLLERFCPWNLPKSDLNDCWLEDSKKMCPGFDEPVTQIIHFFLSKCQKKILLLYGTSGSGKTHIAKSLSQSSGFISQHLVCSDLLCWDENDLVKYIKKLKSLSCNVMLVFDEFESLFDENFSVNCYLVLDLLNSLPKNLLVMCISQRIDIDLKVEFSKTVQLKNMSEQSRKEFCLSFISDSNLCEQVAGHTSGFNAADLVSAMRKIVLSEERSGYEVHSIITSCSVSHLSGFQTKVKDILFSDLVGIEKYAKIVKKRLFYPINNSNNYQNYGITPSKGLLISGDVGTGKTSLSSAILNESRLNIIVCDSAEIRCKLVGQTEQKIKEYFTAARNTSPCILLIENIELLCPKEAKTSRITNCFLTEMDGVFDSSGIVVIATCRDKGQIAVPLLRPGRFDVHIHLKKLEKKEIMLLIQKKACSMPLDLGDDFERLAVRLQGLSVAEIDYKFKEAALIAINKNKTQIQFEDFILTSKQ